ncbi:ArsA family ATPase [Microbulbifer sp. CAU 1566]|uniref:ArsA family ATPase n=1 Tax=Microbulbifer sp. CAU 1566 TaxID=2933269 RepID=UPI0020050ABD|nr:ArsA family ATPase [Microbulbifer sp. CAU 1566]MCK7596968.1 ArsA family ATPase [Microbulbifer sp. CAU 1566]
MAANLNLSQLLQRRLILVGGKGGVGKTTLAATLALLAARRGLNTLLVSTDPAHNLGDLFECHFRAGIADISGEGLPLRALELNPEVAVASYLESIRKQMLPHVALSQRPQLERQLHLTRHSPGAEEAALLDEMTRLIQQREQYDLIIFDTAPTGHTLRLLALPRLMAAWTAGLLAQKKRSGRFKDLLSHLQSGEDINNPFAESRGQKALPEAFSEALPEVLAPLQERKNRFREAGEALRDARTTGFLFVMTPEILPLQETRRAVATLQAERIPVAGLILNRLLPAAAEQVEFLQSMFEQQQAVLDRVEKDLGNLPRWQLSMTGAPLKGREGLSRFADDLLGQLGQQKLSSDQGAKQKLPDSIAGGQ